MRCSCARIGKAVQEADGHRFDAVPLDLGDGARHLGLLERRPARGRAHRCAPRTGRRRRRGTSGGGSSMPTSYCSKRFSWRISMVSRKPWVVISAVLAPLRSISALVASVVP